MAAASPSTQRQRQNWLIHVLYIRKEYDKCMRVIEQQLKECNGLTEYPIYVKGAPSSADGETGLGVRFVTTRATGLIRRSEGKIQESLQLFQAATCLNPHNVSNLKQVGKSLCVSPPRECAEWATMCNISPHRPFPSASYLLAKHRAAIDVYEEALRIAPDDWELWHCKGLCFVYMKKYDEAVDCFQQANSIQRHDATYVQLAKVFTLQEDYKTAIDVLLEALEFSPDNPGAHMALSRLLAVGPLPTTCRPRQSCSPRWASSTCGSARTSARSIFWATRSPTTRGIRRCVLMGEGQD